MLPRAKSTSADHPVNPRGRLTTDEIDGRITASHEQGEAKDMRGKVKFWTRKTCIGCGKDMLACRSDKRYCSRACRPSRSGCAVRSRDCDHCGTTYQVPKRRDYRQHFCSIECLLKADSLAEHKVCISCNTRKRSSEFPVYPSATYVNRICRDCRNNAARISQRRAPDYLAVQRYKNYCICDRRSGFSTALSRRRAVDLMRLPCHWCGEASKAIGLDRIDNSRGHDETNVVPCCARCNHIRSDMPYAAMSLLRDSLVKLRLSGLLDNWIPPFRRATLSARTKRKFGNSRSIAT